MRNIILAIMVIGIYGGCGEDAQMSERDTQIALGLMTGVSSVGAGEARVAAAESGSSEVDVTASCSGGGTVSASGRVAPNGGVELDLSFGDCSEGGVTMDGAIFYTEVLSPDAATLSFTGQVHFAGIIEGTCDFDLEQLAEESGLTTNGQACGHDIMMRFP